MDITGCSGARPSPFLLKVYDLHRVCKYFLLLAKKIRTVVIVIHFINMYILIYSLFF